jgi:hypothetical protein
MLRAYQKLAQRCVEVNFYFDSSHFEFLLSTNSARACRILMKSTHLPKDVLAETKAFVLQHGFALSIFINSSVNS